MIHSSPIALDSQVTMDRTSVPSRLPMRKPDREDTSSEFLARRALLITLAVAWFGAWLGILGARLGTVAENELILISCSLGFSTVILTILLLFRGIALQAVATISTVGFAVNLCAGMVIAVFGPGEHLNLFVYLVWFFPLLLFNKLVNRTAVSHTLARILLLAPILSVAGLSPRLIQIFKTQPLILLTVYCLSYAGFGLMLDIITRYREGFVVERERAESLKAASKVLESISDCFLSLDTRSNLIYLNDAACAELGVERQAALNDSFENAVPGFFSQTMHDGIEEAFWKATATVFEAQNANQDRWYMVRCYPRQDGMSIHFRNITDFVSSRRKLEEARNSLQQQATLLDEARDAILVVDTEWRIRYWNKGAERLYGWTPEEAMGRYAEEIFGYAAEDLQERAACILQNGAWAGEILQRHRDGRLLTVESHCTAMMEKNGIPRSVLAINTDITRRKATEARIEQLAFYDPLTGLPNRLLLRERLVKAQTTTSLRRTMGALLLIDLDDFKTVNDTLGQGTGDMLLEQVALRLMQCSLATDSVARLGSDEFVIMLEGLSNDDRMAAAGATVVGNRILEAFLRPYSIGSHETECTASIGITLFSGTTNSEEMLIKQADLAMYRAKSQGGNRLCFFEPSMQTYVDSRASLRSDIRRALANNELELHYQPQVDSSGRVVGAESLLRWRHPQRGMIPPAEFIPLAEEGGLIIDLGRWVLETACAQIASWASNPAMEGLDVAVNVSPCQFFDSNFVSLVLEVLRKSGANSHRLTIELTESSMIEKGSDTIAKMETLKVCGIRFSLDDFGTGYSSLSHLKRLPLDQLKIDGSFVADMLTDSKDASITRTIIMLGKSLNLTVIAEGVETEWQRDFLEVEDCNVYQGYLFSKPLSAGEFEAYVAHQ
jgi:diguanylate cyclase (GGDEF)-like protein/PAS domain S-box-containing protein